MAKRWVLLICVFLAALVMAARAADIILPDHPERGIAVFKKKHCVECHSIWNEGGQIGPELSNIVRDKSFYQIIGLLWNHFPRMATEMKKLRIGVVEKMNADDMQHLIAYLYYLNFFDGSGDFKKGEILFKDKNCVQCHSVGGAEKKIGPPLDSLGWATSPVYLGSAMWNHRAIMQKLFLETGLPLPVFDKHDLSDLLAYIAGMSVGESNQRRYLEPGNANSGKQIFAAKKCVVCHSVHGQGGHGASDLGTIRLSMGISELTALLWNHSAKMEGVDAKGGMEFPKLEPQEMADLLTYLYFTSFFEEQGNAEEGRRIFKEKGCSSCHSIQGHGGNVAPDLAFSDVGFKSFEFAARIWNHMEGMNELFRDEMIAWPVLQGNEMRDLIFFLRSGTKASSK